LKHNHPQHINSAQNWREDNQQCTLLVLVCALAVLLLQLYRATLYIVYALAQSS